MLGFGQGVKDDAVGDDDPDDIRKVALRQDLVHHRQRHRQQPLEQERTQQDVGDTGPGDGCAADEDGRHAVEAHHQGGVIQLQEAVALGVQHNACAAQGGGNGGAQDAHVVHIDAGGLGKLGVGARCAHGQAHLAAHEQPHQEANRKEEQQGGCGDIEPNGSRIQLRRFFPKGDALLADVDGKGRIAEHLAEAGIQVDGIPQAGAAQGPDHLAVFIGQGQPNDVHKGDGGKSHIGGYRHFRAFDPVQQQAVAHAEHGGDGRTHHHGHRQTDPGVGKFQLNGDGGAQQAAHDAQAHAEIQADAALHRRHHGQHQYAVHDPPAHRIPQQAGDG